jgi:hypothetical protein
MVNVSSAGVTGVISPNPGIPSSAYALTLFNTGTAQDTYKLSVVGPLAQAFSIPPSVTVAGAQQSNIPVTITSPKYLTQGSFVLQIRAVSQKDPSVQTVVSATINVPASYGVTSAIVPSSATVSTNPGSVNLLFNATNTGTVADTYTAQITKTTGPVSAVLVNGGGQSGTSISQFYVSPLGTAQIPLNATVNGTGNGSVTVTVTSLSQANVTSSSTVIINGPAKPGSPAANAGTGTNIPLHRLAILNGSASSDPNTPPLSLSYAWTLVSAPAGSKVNTASIHFPNSPAAAFIPDITGAYMFQLTVSNSAGSSTATVTYNAQIFAPVAVPGKPQNAETGTFVFLNGKDSYDPNGLPVTFAWTFASVPPGSALTAASIFNANTPKPFFAPDISGLYTLRLTVANGTLQSSPQTVQVTAVKGLLAPNARAGADQNAAVAQSVMLDGTGSFDPNSPALSATYLWTFKTIPAGSSLTNTQITNASNPKAEFLPDTPGDFVLNLHLANSSGSSDDTVTVHVFAGYSNTFLKDVPPFAIVNADQYALPGTQVNLDGSASIDPDNGPASTSYNWWLNSLPTASTAAISGATTATPRITPDVPGYYIARLEASDGFASGFANTMVIAANKCDADANGAVSTLDIQLIQAALGQKVGQNDPRDPLAAGTVTAADVTYCQGLITPPPLPDIASTPASLKFSGAVGSSLPSQTLTISSTGAGFAFSVKTDQPWLIATPSSGDTSGNTITVSVVTTSLAAQTYQGNVVITSTSAGNSPFSIPVTLALASTKIVATAGTPQVANLGAQFATPFRVLVTDSTNHPVSGLTVTFTSPATGATGSFTGNASNATAKTDASGTATAPAFTANGTAGNYSLTATVAGATSPATFSLTNAVAGPTSLGGAIGGKSGPSNARVWIFQVGNNGPGSALGAQITSITFQQTSGPACTPHMASTVSFPIAFGNIAPGAVASAPVTVDFSSCASNAAFKVTAAESANNGAATGTIVRLNQFQ